MVTERNSGLCCCNKAPETINFQEERLIFAHSVRGLSPRSLTPLSQAYGGTPRSHGSAAHLVVTPSRAQSQRLSFLSLGCHLPRVPPAPNSAAGWDHPSPQGPLGTLLQTTARSRCIWASEKFHLYMKYFTDCE